MRKVEIVALFLFLLFSGCMNPDEYEEKTKNEVSEDGSEQDAFKETIFHDFKKEIKELHTPEISDTLETQNDLKNDTSGNETFVPDGTQDLLEEETEIPEKCPVTFKVKKTSPVPQEFVYLTGDFLADENGNWPLTPEQGAIPLEDSGDIFKVTVKLKNGLYLKYKYLIKWQDTDVKWCTFDGSKVNEESQGYSCNGDEPPMELFVSCE